jgi:hypothetical protein
VNAPTRDTVTNRVLAFLAVSDLPASAALNARILRLVRLVLEQAETADRCEHHPRSRERARNGGWCVSCGAAVLGADPSRLTRSTSAIVVSGALAELRKLVGPL